MIRQTPNKISTVYVRSCYTILDLSVTMTTKSRKTSIWCLIDPTWKWLIFPIFLGFFSITWNRRF